MKKVKKLDKKGYTVPELLAVLLVFSVLGLLFGYLLRQNAADGRDIERKRDLDAIYFSLEGNKSELGYPEYPDTENLKGIDPGALVDPNGVKLGDSNAEYRYFPAECVSGNCKSYEIKVTLEKEAEFVKKNGS